MSRKKSLIPVIEIFGPTIQGEGYLAGVRTWFVRTGSCDYLKVCGTCDSMHAVDPVQYKKTAKWTEPEDLAKHLISHINPGEWVTISGGNPALWDFSEAVRMLRDAGIRVAVETQGSKFLPWLTQVDLLTVSPKGPGMLAGDHTQEDSLKALHDFMGKAEDTAQYWGFIMVLKIPIFSKGDLDFAEIVAGLYEGYTLYLSVGNPSVYQHNLPVLRDNLLDRYEGIINSVLKRSVLKHAIVLPQLHVLAWGNKQGV